MSDEMKELARQFQSQIEKLERSISLFEDGTFHLSNGDIDVSKEHVAELRHAIKSLEDGIAVCLR